MSYIYLLVYFIECHKDLRRLLAVVILHVGPAQISEDGARRSALRGHRVLDHLAVLVVEEQPVDVAIAGVVPDVLRGHLRKTSFKLSVL